MKLSEQPEQGSNTSLSTNITDSDNNTSTSIPTTRKSYQHIWKTICIIVGIMSISILYKVYLYQTSPQLQSIIKGHFYQLLLYSLPFSIIFMLGQCLAHNHFDKICQQNYIDHNKFTDPQKRKKRCFLIVKWLWNVLYYIFTVIFGFIVLKDTSVVPSWLGGDGSCTSGSMYVNQFTQANLLMKALYLIHFGRHLAKLIQHCFFTPEGNYYQLTLHHSLSTFLIFFSYLMNMWLMGLFVLLIHDFSDVFLIVARIARDMRKINQLFLIFVDIIGGISWIFCRIFLLSFCSIHSCLYTLYEIFNKPQIFNATIAELIFLPLLFMTLMTSALQVVQLFWTYYIVSAFIGSNVSDKVSKNSYD